MTEYLSQPQELTSDDIIRAFSSLAEQYGSSDPSNLPDDDPAVEDAHNLYYDWQAQEEVRLGAGRSSSRIEHEFILTTILVDAGFQEHGYVAVVANDWLVQTLNEAEEAGLVDLALRIKTKILELNKTLPVELRESNTERDCL